MRFILRKKPTKSLELLLMAIRCNSGFPITTGTWKQLHRGITKSNWRYKRRRYEKQLEIYTQALEFLLPLINEQAPPYSKEKRGKILHMLTSLTIGGMVRMCRYDAALKQAEIKVQLKTFVSLPFMRELYDSYAPIPGQSRDIPRLVLSGDIDTLFDHCRKKSLEKFSL